MTGPLFVYIVAMVAGFSVGVLYFWSLWAAVRRRTAGGSGQAFVLSAIVRLTVIGGAVVWGLRTAPDPATLAAVAVGFLIARLGATRLAAPRKGGP